MLIITGARVSALKRINLVMAKLNFKEHCVSKKKKKCAFTYKIVAFWKTWPSVSIHFVQIRTKNCGSVLSRVKEDNAWLSFRKKSRCHATRNMTRKPGVPLVRQITSFPLRWSSSETVCVVQQWIGLSPPPQKKGEVIQSLCRCNKKKNDGTQL